MGDQPPPHFLNRIMRDMGTVLKYPLYNESTPDNAFSNYARIFAVLECSNSVNINVNVPPFFKFLFDGQDSEPLAKLIDKYYEKHHPVLATAPITKTNKMTGQEETRSIFEWEAMGVWETFGKSPEASTDQKLRYLIWGEDENGQVGAFNSLFRQMLIVFELCDKSTKWGKCVEGTAVYSTGVEVGEFVSYNKATNTIQTRQRFSHSVIEEKHDAGDCHYYSNFDPVSPRTCTILDRELDASRQIIRFLQQDKQNRVCFSTSDVWGTPDGNIRITAFRADDIQQLERFPESIGRTDLVGQRKRLSNAFLRECTGEKDGVLLWTCDANDVDGSIVNPQPLTEKIFRTIVTDTEYYEMAPLWTINSTTKTDNKVITWYPPCRAIENTHPPYWMEEIIRQPKHDAGMVIEDDDIYEDFAKIDPQYANAYSIATDDHTLAIVNNHSRLQGNSSLFLFERDSKQRWRPRAHGAHHRMDVRDVYWLTVHGRFILMATNTNFGFGPYDLHIIMHDGATIQDRIIKTKVLRYIVTPNQSSRLVIIYEDEGNPTLSCFREGSGDNFVDEDSETVLISTRGDNSTKIGYLVASAFSGHFVVGIHAGDRHNRSITMFMYHEANQETVRRDQTFKILLPDRVDVHCITPENNVVMTYRSWPHSPPNWTWWQKQKAWMSGIITWDTQHSVKWKIVQTLWGIQIPEHCQSLISPKIKHLVPRHGNATVRLYPWADLLLEDLKDDEYLIFALIPFIYKGETCWLIRGRGNKSYCLVVADSQYRIYNDSICKYFESVFNIALYRDKHAPQVIASSNQHAPVHFQNIKGDPEGDATLHMSPSVVKWIDNGDKKTDADDSTDQFAAVQEFLQAQDTTDLPRDRDVPKQAYAKQGLIRRTRNAFFDQFGAPAQKIQPPPDFLNTLMEVMHQNHETNNGTFL